jgi:hypothetical protein
MKIFNSSKNNKFLIKRITNFYFFGFFWENLMRKSHEKKNFKNQENLVMIFFNNFSSL